MMSIHHAYGPPADPLSTTAPSEDDRRRDRPHMLRYNNGEANKRVRSSIDASLALGLAHA